MIRTIGLFLRWRSQQKQEHQSMRLFEEWRGFLEQWPLQVSTEKKLAIVRLDDIGDYLLWRNFIGIYKQSEQYAAYSITLIGNIVWKDIFDAFDRQAVDETIWVHKQQYLSSESYRNELWQAVRDQKFETIVCPSRTRPLLLDDLMVAASGAPIRIATHNSLPLAKSNIISDAMYNQIFVQEELVHEFMFNKYFASYISGLKQTIQRPFLPISNSSIIPQQVICFIGAAAQSKTWPLQYWIELVNLLQEAGFEPLLSGGKNEILIAEKIVAATHVHSIVGQSNLVDTLNAIASSLAVITGDTMAAHAAVSLNMPSVILANGVNAQRFVAYEQAGFDRVKTVFTQQYLSSKKDKHYRAVTKDMESIKPNQIMLALNSLLSR
jgi:ADP-heptose:LPS heptosyltransferase